MDFHCLLFSFISITKKINSIKGFFDDPMVYLENLNSFIHKDILQHKKRVHNSQEVALALMNQSFNSLWSRIAVRSLSCFWHLECWMHCYWTLDMCTSLLWSANPCQPIAEPSGENLCVFTLTFGRIFQSLLSISS